MKKTLSDYQNFFEISPSYSIIGLFFFLSLVTSVTTFVLPFFYFSWYKRMPKMFVIFQISAIFFFCAIVWEFFLNNINTHLEIIIPFAVINFLFNWMIYDRIIQKSAQRVQVKKNGLKAIEVSGTLTDIKTERKKFGTSVGT